MLSVSPAFRNEIQHPSIWQDVFIITNSLFKLSCNSSCSCVEYSISVFRATSCDQRSPVCKPVYPSCTRIPAGPLVHYNTGILCCCTPSQVYVVWVSGPYNDRPVCPCASVSGHTSSTVLNSVFVALTAHYRCLTHLALYTATHICWGKITLIRSVKIGLNGTH